MIAADIPPHARPALLIISKQRRAANSAPILCQSLRRGMSGEQSQDPVLLLLELGQASASEEKLRLAGYRNNICSREERARHCHENCSSYLHRAAKLCEPRQEWESAALG